MKTVSTTNSCYDCPNRGYHSGGRYNVKRIINHAIECADNDTTTVESLRATLERANERLSLINV